MANLQKTVILSAPAGWGKTRQSAALMKEFGCQSLVDAWDPSTSIRPGALHLTNEPPHAIPHHLQALVVARGW